MKWKSRVGLVSIFRVLSAITFVNGLSVKMQTFFFTDSPSSISGILVLALGVLIQITDMVILDGILRIYPSYKKFLENILVMKILRIKGSSDTIHFIFEINVGKSRIRHRTTLDFEC